MVKSEATLSNWSVCLSVKQLKALVEKGKMMVISNFLKHVYFMIG